MRFEKDRTYTSWMSDIGWCDGGELNSEYAAIVVSILYTIPK